MEDEKDTNMASGGVILNFDKGMAYTDIDRPAPRKLKPIKGGRYAGGRWSEHGPFCNGGENKLAETQL